MAASAIPKIRDVYRRDTGLIVKVVARDDDAQRVTWEALTPLHRGEHATGQAKISWFLRRHEHLGKFSKTATYARD